jgi:hypothetical protein
VERQVVDHAGVPLQVERIEADEQRLVPGEPRHRVAGSDPDHARVGLDAHDGHPERGPRTPIPGRPEGRIEREAVVREPDSRDAQVAPPYFRPLDARGLR